MQCDAYDSGRCRSCTLIDQPYADQVTDKVAACRTALGDPSGLVWLPPVVNREQGFRAKAKMVVGGTVEAPTLGILDADGQGVDLQDCRLYPPAITSALPVLAGFVTTARLVPYDVVRRSGELKHLIVTQAPDGALMVRFVLRSTEPVARLRKHLPDLERSLPDLAVASVNLLPEHRAVLEGEREILLTARSTLPMTLNGITLHARPQGFVQTSTDVAAALYRQVRDWVDEVGPRSVWDLYCGMGGFALHCAAEGRAVTGVEVNAEAVGAARDSAAAAGLDARFVIGDATTFARDAAQQPELVVVNPPRRGLGAALAGWLERSDVRHVVYSSCNAPSLARDLDRMPSLRPRQARLLDMFPQTTHSEVVVLLERGASGPVRSSPR